MTPLVYPNTKIALLQRRDDGRPNQSAAAAADHLRGLWKPRATAFIMWATCFSLIAFLIFCTPIYSSNSLNSLIRAEQRDLLKTLPSAVPPFTDQDHITPPSPDYITPPPPDSDATKLIDFSVGGCNIWRGDWIPHPHEPAYTNATCGHIQDAQNCIKLERPDLDFLYWRWKPHDCELQLFDATAFLQIVAGKTWAFIGDSLARNSFQSVLCHLEQVENPELCTYDGWNIHCYFRSYNFTIAVVWAPFLVKYAEQTQGPDKLDLDVLDESWGSQLDNYDYIVLSTGRWFMRTALYFVQNELVGCYHCGQISSNGATPSDVGVGFGYRSALRTVFHFLISSKYKGVVLFRTFSPDHFEHAPWNEGGNCTRKAPFKSSSTALDPLSYFIYNMQLEEFGKIVHKSSEFEFKLKIVDTLYASLLRPDAHPGQYGRSQFSVHNDCVHWCLPGAVDTWSAMLLHVLKHL